jgi:hypothetical protein
VLAPGRTKRLFTVYVNYLKSQYAEASSVKKLRTGATSCSATWTTTHQQAAGVAKGLVARLKQNVRDRGKRWRSQNGRLSRRPDMRDVQRRDAILRWAPLALDLLSPIYRRCYRTERMSRDRRAASVAQ